MRRKEKTSHGVWCHRPSQEGKPDSNPDGGWRDCRPPAVFTQENFPKKTNDTDEDWTDIEGAIAALNASKTDRALWRSRLEARFDVNSFLRWLALNTMVGNTDAYGGLSAHNYYLYGSPRHRDRLFWIPWDHDLAMSGGANLGGVGGGNPGGGGAGGAQTVDIFNNASPASWPLIASSTAALPMAYACCTSTFDATWREERCR